MKNTPVTQGRRYVPVRLGAAGEQWLTRLAEEETARSGVKITRSDAIRAALAVAKYHEKEVLTIMRGQI